MKRIFYIALVCLIATSCIRRELSYSYDPTYTVKVRADWSELSERPSGMSVYCYPEDGGSPVVSLSNNVDSTTVKLPLGEYNILVFNQTTTEFATLTFSGMSTYEDAEVSASATTSKWAVSRAESELVNNPSEFAAATYLGLEITEEMIDTVLYCQNNDVEWDYNLEVVVDVVPQLLIKTTRVKVGVLGFHNLYSTRATLFGMAAGYDFSQQMSHTAEVTHVLEGWSAIGSEVYGEGDIYIYFPCFGLPNQTTATRIVEEWDGIMDLEILLVDRSTIESHSFDLAEYTTLADPTEVKADTDNVTDTTATADIYVDIPKSFTLPDVEPEEGTEGGFDATVEDWGEEVTVVVPL
ncbi:MAG: DUF5119 domain-containing protein [Rikenellaceae bacterium]